MVKSFDVVTFQASDGVQLNGLLSLPKSPKGVCIYVHGLTSSAFTSLGHAVTPMLNKAGYGIFILNTRGAGLVTGFKREDKRKASGFRYETFGTTFETFTDSVHDLDGAVLFLKSHKLKNIVFIGSSTGCQKSVYYLSQRGKQRGIMGIVLLSPLSDRVVIQSELGSQFDYALAHAKWLVNHKQKDAIMPAELTDFMLSAQRFVSLTDLKSEEEIFTYSNSKKPKTLESIKVPTLAVLGDKDEYNDRPVLELVEWYENTLQAKKKRVEWIEGADHGFTGKEKQVGAKITTWLDTIS
ncbi:DUF1749 domain-containing protein [candidate division WWE3 bacterium]|uniref:DUF1749 domain-containing protein n=1 Tax=candidate division WWE3 bacterium TaxID=2053526 RepID=A0A955RPJ4_UNCKA|nr:DUF1749 domain-containing protein [candidate division WWE3 bacterium]